MTLSLDEAFEAMDAAGAIADTLGWSCAPVLTLQEMRIDLRRGLFERRIVVVSMERMVACSGVGRSALRELVEREVARACSGRASA